MTLMRNILFLVLACYLGTPAAATKQKLLLGDANKPNIVFILTDDQDLHMDSLDYMPKVHEHLIAQGTFYKQHYCTTGVCCPSRVTLWTGKLAHNTNVTDINPPYGGYPKFVSQGHNENWLPVWMQAAGYNTFYTGKLFNSHSIWNYNTPHPKGFTSSDFLLDPYTYQYLNATMQRNDQKPVSYSTDVIASKAFGMMDEAVDLGKPFFLTIATNAPHSNSISVDPATGVPINPKILTAPIPAERHQHLFPDVKIPRKANFNPEIPSGVGWIKELPELNDTVIEYNDYFYRRRLQTLQAVDELVEGVVSRLQHHEILDNTYIIYSTDNGYHISQHRLHPGKECGFEEDINIPLIIRGPGVPKGFVTHAVTAHADIAPTILNLAGADLREDFDGKPIPVDASSLVESAAQGTEHVNVEFWGVASPEGDYGFEIKDGEIAGWGLNNTYKALRIISDTYNLYYAVWCSNEHELYDLMTDPHEIHNLFPGEGIVPERTLMGHPISKVITRLDHLLLVLKSCKGETCSQPWKVLHPDGDVENLKDALSTKFDAFYDSSEARVSFSRCELGYILDAEGPQVPPTFRRR